MDLTDSSRTITRYKPYLEVVRPELIEDGPTSSVGNFALMCLFIVVVAVTFACAMTGALR